MLTNAFFISCINITINIVVVKQFKIVISVKSSVTLCLIIIPAIKRINPIIVIASASLIFFENKMLISAHNKQTLKKLCSIKFKKAVSINPIAKSSVAKTKEMVSILTKLIFLMLKITRKKK